MKIAVQSPDGDTLIVEAAHILLTPREGCRYILRVLDAEAAGLDIEVAGRPRQVEKLKVLPEPQSRKDRRYGSRKDVVYAALKSRPLGVKEIAAQLGLPSRIVGATLQNHKRKLFRTTGNNKWATIPA